MSRKKYRIKPVKKEIITIINIITIFCWPKNANSSCYKRGILSDLVRYDGKEVTRHLKGEICIDLHDG